MSIETRLAAAGLPPLPRTAWLTIDLEALSDNVRTLVGLAGPGASLCAVVKADAYGHGIEAVSRTVATAGASMLGVVAADEATAIRRAGVRLPILLLYPPPPSLVAELARIGVEPAVGAIDGLAELLAAWKESGAAARGTLLRVHLEVETGLGRTGVPAASVVACARDLAATPGVVLAAIWSHLADAGDARTSAAQQTVLASAFQAVSAAGLRGFRKHLVASGGLLAGTDVGGPDVGDLVRPGLALYGVVPDDLPVAPDRVAAASRLRPAMTLTARPVRVADVAPGVAVGYGGRWVATRPSRIATLPVGYGDGYRRGLSPGAEALVRGRRVPLVGTISMDAVAVDVTDVPGVSGADELVLLGAQEGERITAADLARRCTSISWEVLAGMSRRLPRVYHAGAGVSGVRTLSGEFLVREGSS